MTRRERSIDVGVAAVALGALGVLVWSARAFVTDDAYISLRYAQQIGAGAGPVWNAGDAPCEGYSNPLLVLIEALSFALGGDGLAVARLLGVAAAVLLVVVTWRLARHAVDPVAALVATVLVGASPSIALWSVSGLETAPAAVLLATATLLLARPQQGMPRLAGLLLAALPWLRPEGIVVALALAAASEGPALVRGDRRTALARLAWLVGPVVAGFGALLLLRLAWFGHAVPNPVFYKVGHGSGGVLGRFLLDVAPAVPFVLIGLTRLRGRAWLVVVAPVAYLAGAITASDSVNALSRFMIPALAPCLLVAAAGVAVAVPTGAGALRRAGLVAGATLLLAAALFVAPRLPSRDGAPALVSAPVVFPAVANEYMACKARVRWRAGAWIRTRLRPGDVYAIGDAGLVPWIAGGRALDIFGLNDPLLRQTGRSPSARAARVVSERPRFVLLSSLREDLRPQYPAERAVAAVDVFASGWAPVETISHPACDYRLRIWERH